jgi:putative SOS response-associated peptidase YedK
MCSRYSLTSPAEAVRAYFKVGGADAFPPRYNIAPTQPVPIVRVGTAGSRELVLVRWGLIPSWVKDPREFTTLINARSEGALDKPSFRNAMKYRRCLIPANGFYEWTGPKGDKRPYLIRPSDGGLMAFAGLWEHWQGVDGSELETMAILTTSANRTLAPIHDRMPVILQPDEFEDWLDARGHEAKEAVRMLVPAADDLLKAVAVDKAINSSRRDGPELQKPAPEQRKLL